MERLLDEHSNTALNAVPAYDVIVQTDEEAQENLSIFLHQYFAPSISVGAKSKGKHKTVEHNLLVGMRRDNDYCLAA